MKVIVVDNVKFRVHPIYENYAASKSGKVINVRNKIPIKGHSFNGYQYMLNVTKKNIKPHVGRFIWECFNGVIEDKQKVIFHVNKDPRDNRLCNLKLTTMSDVSKEVYSHEKLKKQNL